MHRITAPDHLGFEQPSEYFSKLAEGSFHGMPWFQYDGNDFIRDPCQSSPPPFPANSVAKPVALFPARNAPMDVAFVPQTARASEFIGDAIVALRGSWGTAGDGSAKGDKRTRRPPKLVRVVFEKEKATSVEDLLTGLQLPDTGDRWLRPVGVAIGPDGDIYFTSDAVFFGPIPVNKNISPMVYWINDNNAK